MTAEWGGKGGRSARIKRQQKKVGYLSSIPSTRYRYMLIAYKDLPFVPFASLITIVVILAYVLRTYNNWIVWKYNNIIFLAFILYLEMRIVDAHNSQPTFRALIMNNFPEEPTCTRY